MIKAATAATDRPALLVGTVPLSVPLRQPMRVHASIPCPQLQLLHQLVPVSLPLQPSVTTSPPVSVQLSPTDVMPTPLQSELFIAQVVEFQ